MRGDKEKKCLNFAYKKFNHEACYALSKRDYESMEIYFTTALPNKNSNEFPDFNFEGGFIEHFQITSSPEGRKGAKHIEGKSRFIEGFKNRENDFIESVVNTHCERKSVSSCFPHSNHSYENFINSFKRNWENHIKSLKSSSMSSDKIGVFMVQYCDHALEMYENIFEKCLEGLSLPIRNPQHFYDYKLSRDIDLLRYMADYANIIKYVIFVNSSEIEIISTENIEEIIKLLPWRFCIAPKMNTIEVKTTNVVTIPNSDYGGEQNDNS